MSEDKYFSTVNEFREETPAKKMITTAIKEIIPVKGSKFAFTLSLTLAVMFSLKIGIAENTIEILLSIVDKLFAALLAIFGFLFTIYSLLLVFLNESYIQKLSQIAYNKETSYLKKSTTYFESILFLYFITVGISGLLLIFLLCCTKTFVLTSNWVLNDTLAVALLILYFTIVFRVFYELKSAIYNTIVLFRLSLAYKILAIAEKEKEDQSNDKD